MSIPILAYINFNHRYVIDKRQIEFTNRNIPKDRFIQYEPRDLDWMIPLGMAPEIVVDPHLVRRAAKIIDKKMDRCICG